MLTKDLVKEDSHILRVFDRGIKASKTVRLKEFCVTSLVSFSTKGAVLKEWKE